MRINIHHEMTSTSRKEDKRRCEGVSSELAKPRYFKSDFETIQVKAPTSRGHHETLESLHLEKKSKSSN